MEYALPTPGDHCRVHILVKPIGHFPSAIFNQLLKKLENKLSGVEVLTSKNIRRVIFPKFVQQVDPNLAKFAEFQAFRKVFGLVCIGQYNNNGGFGGLTSSFASSPNLSPNQNNNFDDNLLRRCSVAKMVVSSSSVADSSDYISSKSDEEEENLIVEDDPEIKQMNILKNEYQENKHEYNDQLVDSRCVLFGFSSTQNSTEILSFPRSDDISLLFDQLEVCTRDLLRSIYVVLDSKRLDISFEKMEFPPYLLLQEEEKYLMGIDNVKSKNHKKKCIGRLRKRLADYAFLTGYFEGALNSYNSSIELLKSTQDLLWLAAATEGWCCAAMMLKYSHYLSPSIKEDGGSSGCFGHSNKMENRISTSTSQQQQHHSRYRRSDDTAKIKIIKNVESLDNDDNNSSSSSSTFVGNKTFPLEEDVKNDELNKQNQQLLLPNNLIKNNLLNNHQIPTTTKMLPSPPSSLGMSSSFKSCSVQNLSNSNNFNNNLNKTTLISSNKNNKNILINKNEIFEKFGQSLENYARYSFAVFIEYECMMRSVHLQIVNHQYIEVEAFLREQTCRFLDDKFIIFNNIIKSNICLATANIYKKIGFKRKFSFFLRLSVFFRLYMENQTEAEYKKVYPYLNESLIGYQINNNNLNKLNCFSSSNSNNKNSLKKQFLTKFGNSPETFSLQIKAVHEVFTVAIRAGFFEIATRHLCFMLEAFFDHLDKATSLALVEELTKLNLQNNSKIKKLHDLEKPITLDSVPSVLLPPLQFTKFPIIKNVCILPLAEHLSPSIHPSSLNESNIFIYSPFEQQKIFKDIYWVVGCHCGISFNVENPLAIELIVDNLKLIVEEEGNFEPLNLRLNLPSCYNGISNIDNNNKEEKNLVKLLGIPRLPGMLKIIGYSCELLGCRNICKFTNINKNNYSVRILPNLPLLKIETTNTSLNRSPTLFENPNEAIAELCIFSGQSFPCKLALYNSSCSVGIKKINIKIQQPQVAAGTKLLRIIDANSSCSDFSLNKSSDDELILFDHLKAGERRELIVLIFGIDPSIATPLNNNIGQKSLVSGKTLKFGDEHKVYVRRPTSLSSSNNLTTTIISDVDLPLYQLKEKEEKNKQKTYFKKQQQQNNIHSTVSTPLLKQQSSDDDNNIASTSTTNSSNHYDLIPYTGRLLLAEITFTYTADVKTENGEQYIRFAKLPLAITIVPAVILSNWQVLAGDGPYNRYVAIDLSNQTENEAQLIFGSNNKKTTIVVQPKDICRVPLLCPCCTEIKSILFQKITKCASYILQMQEIALLRSKIEKHLLSHLEINWRIEQLNLNGQVPVGSLLSSVSFLRQMALPTLTISMQVDNNEATTSNNNNNNDINVVQVGEIVCISIAIYFSIKGILTGELSLGCYQNFQNKNNNNNASIEHSDKFFIFGPNKLPIKIEQKEEEKKELKNKEDNNNILQSNFTTKICLSFCFEGIYKICPKFEKIELFEESSIPPYILTNEDIFMTQLSFSVINK